MGMTFPSDIAPETAVRTIAYGTPDQADLWLATPSEDEWGDWLEATYDPDC